MTLPMSPTFAQSACSMSTDAGCATHRSHPGDDIVPEGSPVQIRAVTSADVPALVDLTIETFRPFYEDVVPPMLGDVVFTHQHGRWEQDYRDEVPTLHDPTAGRHAAVAVGNDGWPT